MSYIHMFFEYVRGENKGFDLLHLRDDGAMYAECVNTWKENWKKRKNLLEDNLHLKGSKLESFRLADFPLPISLCYFHRVLNCAYFFSNLRAVRGIQFNSLVPQP